MRFLLLLLFLVPSVADAQIFRFRRAVPVQPGVPYGARQQQGVQFNGGPLRGTVCANGQCARGGPLWGTVVTPSVVASVRHSPSELRAIIASSPAVPHVRVNGSTYRHLQDSRHGFTASQLSGLSQAELSKLHDLEHYGLVKPYRAKSVAVTKPTPEKPYGARQQPVALKHPTSINI